MGRPKKRRRTPRRGSGGQFQRRECPASAADTPPPPDDSTLSTMEVDDDQDRDEDYRDESAGAASGSGQATLSFVGSAAACVMSAAIRTAESTVCPEVAPLQSAAQPHRSTIARRKKAALNAAKPGMMRGMAAFLRRGSEQQVQQASLPRSSEREGAVEMEVEIGDHDSSSTAAAPVDATAVVSMASRSNGDSSSDSSSDSDSCSESDMIVDHGIGLPSEAWVGGAEQSAAQGVLEQEIDGYLSGGSDGFLDALDYPSSRSESSEGGESGAEFDGNAEPLDDDGAAAATGTERASSCGTGAGSAEKSAVAVRRSSRETATVAYYPPGGTKAKSTAGPGRGIKVLLADEVDSSLTRLKRRDHKKQRLARNPRVRLVGKKWTPEQRARRARRTRSNCSERKQELLATFRKGLDKIQKVRVSSMCVVAGVCV